MSGHAKPQRQMHLQEVESVDLDNRAYFLAS